MYHVLPEGLHGSCTDAAVELSTLTAKPSVQFATSRCLAYLIQELASFQLVGDIRKQVLIAPEFVARLSVVLNKLFVLELQLIVLPGQLLVRRLQAGQLQQQQPVLSVLLGTQVCDYL